MSSDLKSGVRDRDGCGGSASEGDLGLKLSLWGT